MSDLLNDNQLTIILKHDELFEGLAPLLEPRLQTALLDLQIRAGNTFMDGPWNVPATGETFTNPDCPQPPTVSEATVLFEESYAALPEDNPLRKSLEAVISELGFSPVAPLGTSAAVRNLPRFQT
ncbi:MAG: hypothetical protein WAO98_07700 [Alphaproteobacteria bacterium]